MIRGVTFKIPQAREPVLFRILDCTNKEAAVIQALYTNAFANGFTEIEYIDDDNDARTKMDIR
ncbi:MAG: DUF2691 family protein [Christensenellaceae bacterium]|jgi:hypothetical protein|nr:DUF2691 family protein [Christensenellaceae bacterium]